MLEKIGFSPSDRLLIINADDLGISPEANAAITDLFEQGAVSSSSLMMPAPWAKHAIDSCKGVKHAAVGIHLTLTGGYKPVSRSHTVSSLLTAGGHFPNDTVAVEKYADPAHVMAELRNQIEQAIALGLDPTHLDNHQGSLLGLATGRDFLEVVFDLCEEYRLPLLFPKRIVEQPFFTPEQKLRFTARIESAARRGIPLIDDIVAFPYSLETGETYESYKWQMIAALRQLQPGITQVVLHPSRGGDRYPEKREMEYRIFLDPDLRRLLTDENIRTVSWREIRSLLR